MSWDPQSAVQAGAALAAARCSGLSHGPHGGPGSYRQAEALTATGRGSGQRAAPQLYWGTGKRVVFLYLYKISLNGLPASTEKAI